MIKHKNRFLQLLFIFLIIGMSLWIVFQNNDWHSIKQVLTTLHPEWLLLACACWFFSSLLDGMVLNSFLKKHNHRVSVSSALHVSLMGSFYSAITPGASGGQPMQIYHFSKKGIPVGVSTSAISLRFVLSQFSAVVISLVLAVVCRPLFRTQLSGVQWLIMIGWIIHLAGVVLILLATFFKTALQKIARRIILTGTKLRLIRDPDAVSAKLNNWIETYHENVRSACRHPSQLLLPFLLTTASLFLIMLIPLCVYKAFGLNGSHWPHLIVIAYMLYLSASYNPLPGASGAQEGGFLVFFKGIFPQGQISIAMLFWRFFSYYLYLITGAVLLMIRTLYSLTKKKSASKRSLPR